MKYDKPFLSYEQQADQLLARGLQGDRDTLIGHLQAVSYYRLSGYWHPLRQRDPNDRRLRLDQFDPHATVAEVWDRYVFDRRLRLLVMDALERIEIDARTRLAYLHTDQHGPFGFATEPSSLPYLLADERLRLLEAFRDDYQNSREEFVEHFRAKYGSHHNDLPLWMACELMPFGRLSTLYRGCHADIQKAVARRYGVPDRVCKSWLVTLNTVRNICAHHARLWNRVLGVRPLIPRHDPRWQYEKDTPQGKVMVPIPNNRVFAVLTICCHLLGVIAPGSEWTERFKQLLADFPTIPPAGLGLIDGWDQHPLWS